MFLGKIVGDLSIGGLFFPLVLLVVCLIGPFDGEVIGVNAFDVKKLIVRAKGLFIPDVVFDVLTGLLVLAVLL